MPNIHDSRSFASICGIAGAVISMGQTWYVGPVASKVSPFGGDMGFEFAAVFTGVVYPPLRWLEIRRWRRWSLCCMGCSSHRGICIPCGQSGQDWVAMLLWYILTIIISTTWILLESNCGWFLVGNIPNYLVYKFIPSLLKLSSSNPHTLFSVFFLWW